MGGALIIEHSWRSSAVILRLSNPSSIVRDAGPASYQNCSDFASSLSDSPTPFALTLLPYYRACHPPKKNQAIQGHCAIGEMLNDMNVSANQYYSESFSVYILKKSAWPIEQTLRDTKGYELFEQIQCIQALQAQKFSLQQFTRQNKRINWVLTEGIAELLMRAEGRQYKVRVNTIGMILLLEYNQRDSYTYGELQRNTGFPDKYLKLILETYTREGILEMRGENLRFNSAFQKKFNNFTCFVNLDTLNVIYARL